MTVGIRRMGEGNVLTRVCLCVCSHPREPGYAVGGMPLCIQHAGGLSVKDKTRLRGYSSKIISIRGEAEDDIILEETQVRGCFIYVTSGYTLRIFFKFTLGFKLPVGDVNGPSRRHSGPVQEI